jgi:hypothetical protein
MFKIVVRVDWFWLIVLVATLVNSCIDIDIGWEAVICVVVYTFPFCLPSRCHACFPYAGDSESMAFERFVRDSSPSAVPSASCSSLSRSSALSARWFREGGVADQLELTPLYIRYSHRPFPPSVPPAVSPKCQLWYPYPLNGLNIPYPHYRSSAVKQRLIAHNPYFALRYLGRNLLLILRCQFPSSRSKCQKNTSILISRSSFGCLESLRDFSTSLFKLCAFSNVVYGCRRDG